MPHGSLPHHHASGGHSREHSGSMSPSSRMSFAVSSFGQSPGNTLLDQRMSSQHSSMHSPADDLVSSFTAHAGIGPGGRSSFSGGQPAGSTGAGNDRGDARDLTPREVVELARSTSRGQVDAGRSHRRTSSTGHASSALGVSAGSLGGRHRIVPQAPTFPDRPAPEDEYEPVEFHPMEDDMMLPFDDRPDEVKALIEAERNRGLFKLLALALPSSPTAEETAAAGGAQPTSRPEDWSFPELTRFLTQTPRTAVGDKAWVITIRKAVEGRSEPLWEKLKGLLGIDEDDDWGDDEPHLVGEASQSESGHSGSFVLIEGLEEGGSQEDAGYDSDGRRTASSDGGHDAGEGMVAGGMFSPEAATSATLPGASALGELEAIGESEEEEMDGGDNDVGNSSLRRPTRQQSTDSNRTLGGGGGLGGLSGVPTLITTGPSPSSSFTDPSRHGLVGSAAAATPVPGDVSPFSSPINGSPTLGSGSGAQTPQGSSPGVGSSPLSTSMTAAGGMEGGRPPRRSFVGVSIVSSSSAEEYHQHHHSTSTSAAPSTGISPSVSNHDLPTSPSLSTSPSFPLHPPVRRRTSVTRDDLQYGGNEASDPMTERGPGNPLFPSSFSNLSLKPWSRPSMSGRPGVASKENDDSGNGSRSNTPKSSGDNNRDWAREMIGLKAGEKLSASAYTGTGTCVNDRQADSI